MMRRAAWVACQRDVGPFRRARECPHRIVVTVERPRQRIRRRGARFLAPQHAHGGPRCRPAGPALLQHVRKLVSEQTTSAEGGRRVRAAREHDVAAHGVGQRVHVTRRHASTRVGVNARVRQIDAEPRLHGSARRAVQRTAR